MTPHSNTCVCVPVSDELHSLLDVVDGEDRQHRTKQLGEKEGRGGGVEGEWVGCVRGPTNRTYIV